MCLVLEFLEFLKVLELLEFLELGDGVLSFGCFAIVKCCCVLWNLCWLKNLKAQGTCPIFRTTPNLPHLLRSVLECWECGFVKYCFVLWNLYCLKRLENQGSNV